MGKGSTRRRGKGYGDGYDKIDWSIQQEPESFDSYPPMAGEREIRCPAQHPTRGFLCMVRDGHKGPHAAYTDSPTTPIAIWSRDV